MARKAQRKTIVRLGLILMLMISGSTLLLSLQAQAGPGAELYNELLEKGVIYPDGKQNDWYWNYAKVVDVPEEDRDQYEGHDKRLDIENPEVFGQYEFMDACQAMGIIKDLDG